MGVIAMLDECCLITESTDVTFLEKCNKYLPFLPISDIQELQLSRSL